MKALQFNKSKDVKVDVDGILQQVKFWVNDAFSGEYIISMERVKKSRTNEQNKLMWVWFTCLAESYSEAYGEPFTPQNLHDYYASRFIPITVDGVNLPGKTSKLTTEQMTDFLNRVHEDAAKKDIILYSINDPEYELWSRQYRNNNNY